jgi:D-xylulose reductase
MVEYRFSALMKLTMCPFSPADLCYLLPESVTLEDGAMMEPLSVAVHSVSSLGKLKSGQNVIVFGAGPVGLLIMAVAKALGAKKIVAVDINEERLKFAKGYAATHTFVPVSRASRSLFRGY